MADRYITLAGSDVGGDGLTHATAWRHANFAVPFLGPGDRLFVGGGNYDESLIYVIPTGSAGNPVTIQNYNGETVWFTPTNSSNIGVVTIAGTPATSGNVGVSQYIVLDGINLDASLLSTGNTVKIESATNYNAHHITITNCELIGSTLMIGGALNGQMVILATCQTADNIGFNTFTNLVLHHCGGSGTFGYGLYCQVSDTVITGCEIYDTNGAGIQVYNGYVGDAQASRNIIGDCSIHDLYRSADTRIDGIIIGRGLDNFLYNNVIYNISGHPDLFGVYIFHGTRTLVYNHTIYGVVGNGIYVGGDSTDAEIINNVCYSNSTNFTDLGSGTTVTTNSTSGTDPLFVNPSVGDFTLQAASPLINAGTTLASVPLDKAGLSRPQGASYCIGAYEYAVGSSGGGFVQVPASITMTGDTSGGTPPPPPPTPSTGGVPIGSIIFAGYGNFPELRFTSPAGAYLDQPPNAFDDYGYAVDWIASIVPSGKIAVVGGGNDFGQDPPIVLGTTGVGILAADFSTHLESADGARGGPRQGGGCDALGNFYGCDGLDHGGVDTFPLDIYRYDSDGAQTGNWTVSGSGSIVNLAVNSDGTIAYYVLSGSKDTIRAWDLAGDTDLGTFTTESGKVANGQNNILVVGLDDIIIGWNVTGAGTGTLKRYDAAGTLQHTYTLDGSNQDTIALTPALTASSFWINYYTSASSTFSGCRVAEFDLTTGSVLHSFDPDDGSGFFYDSVISLMLVGGVPLTFENPCTIKDPVVFGAIQSGTDTPAMFATAPLRDRTSLWSYGGPKQARIIDPGTYTKASSDWLSGNWPVQSGTMVVADTDGVIRTILAARNGDMLTAQIWAMYISNVSRKLRTFDPRSAFQGIIYDNNIGPNFGVSFTGNDVIGINYRIRSGLGDIMVPQRPLEPDFPGFGYINTSSVSEPETVCAPIIYGRVSDEDSTTWFPGQTRPAGEIPVIYIGDYGPSFGDGLIRSYGLVAGHACKEIENLYQAATDSADPTNPFVALTDYGGTCWAFGQTGWTDIVTSGVGYIEINGRRYTVVAFTGDTAARFKDGSGPIYANIKGVEDAGNTTGVLITDLVLQYKHFMLNFLPTPGYQTGTWDTIGDIFEWFPGSDKWLPRVLASSWDVASATGTSDYLASGLQGAFVLGIGGKQQPLRSVLSQFNVQANVSLGWNRYNQLFVYMLPSARADFVGDRRTVSGKRDMLANPLFEAPIIQELLGNNLRFGWGQSPHNGQFRHLDQIPDNLSGGGAVSLAQYGSILCRPESYTMIRDTDTAEAVAQARVNIMAMSRRRPRWAEGPCGLRNDILDGVPISNDGGPGATGYQDNAVWIRKMVTQLGTGITTFEAMDMEVLFS